MLIVCFVLSPQYPKGILKYEYWPNFAVRGLHYDIAKVRWAQVNPENFTFYCMVLGGDSRISEQRI